MIFDLLDNALQIFSVIGPAIDGIRQWSFPDAGIGKAVSRI
jgi:hypothetical protein